MSVSTSYKIYVLEQLHLVGPITARAMFGGVGLYSQGTFFGLIDDDTLYLKVDQSTRPEFELAGSRAFRPYGDDSYSMLYYELPSEVLEDREILKEWVQKAVAVARRSATARKKKPGSSGDRP
jgi:DNA transformation protein and related proteins